MKNKYTKPNKFVYFLAKIVAFLFSTVVFRRKTLRNEIKGVKGPYVVIANHQSAYDFVNLIGATTRRMTFVISNSFYNSLPITGLLEKLAVIPKQQFQTSTDDMRKMKAVVDSGNPLVIYPAGLMSEDGASTPIPTATYKFIKWLGVDVYIARISGTYFAMPKWSKGFRRGRTYIDIYKLYDKEVLSLKSIDEIKVDVDDAILFDAYREQEMLMVRYEGGNNIQGLENVLYACPHCMREFSIQVKNQSTIFCTACGYEESSDEYAFLHNKKGIGAERRYVSDWSRSIYEIVYETVKSDPNYSIESDTSVLMLDYKKHKFSPVGKGHVKLTAKGFELTGTVNSENVEITIPINNMPMLPFSPGNYIELQRKSEIFRCVLDDGRLVMKFIHVLKAFNELEREKFRK